MVVVRPIDASEAAIAVRLAARHRVPFVVRGGGHSPSGSSASSGGMVIDLGLMRGVSTDRAARLVTFGGGCIWEDVDRALWAEGFATPGGTVSHTGVGGLILGGGYSLLTGRHGLSIDNLVRCEVVLASGVVVTASADENADLFWALRGAGHSFGIVTAFTSRMHAQGMVWGGLVAYPMSALPALVAFANTFAATNDGGQAMLLMLGCHPKTLAPCMATSLFYDGPREDAERFYAPVLGLEKMLDRTGVVPYPVANTFANPKTPPGKRYMFSGASFVCPLEAGMVREASDRFHEMLAREGNDEIKTRSMVGFELTPDQKVKSIPVGDTAFANREGAAYNAIVNISWDTEERDAEAKDICATIAKFLRDSGWQGHGPGSHSATYLNYLSKSLLPCRAGRIHQWPFTC